MVARTDLVFQVFPHTLGSQDHKPFLLPFAAPSPHSQCLFETWQPNLNTELQVWPNINIV